MIALSQLLQGGVRVCARRRRQLVTSLHLESSWKDSFAILTNMLRKEDVAAMRTDYVNETFCDQQLASKDPMAQFDAWFREAASVEEIGEANAMTLATSDAAGQPSARIVLLKGYDDRGFRFFSNYSSQKAKALQENPHACLLFYWHPLHRQVKVQGRVERLPSKESEEYFQSRPRHSQIGALVSKQSTVIASREVLDERKEKLNAKYADDSQPIPKPDFWGGYVVVPELIEFWQGQSGRLHDRIVFRKPRAGEEPDGNFTKQGHDGWVYERLSP